VVSLSWENPPYCQINYRAKAFTIVLYTRTDMQSKVTIHAKRKENVTINQGRK
jgi:hypothetical protein